MSATTPIENQEANVQERAIATQIDNSLPAAQVIEAQESQAEKNTAPRFIP